MFPPRISRWFSGETGIALLEGTARPVSGGCIHEAWLVDRGDGGLAFFKLNAASRLPLLEAEKTGLEQIAGSGTLRVPRPLAIGSVEDRSVLALEGLELGGRPDTACHEHLAERLTAMHNCSTVDGRFGAEADNFIGATPQRNGWSASWADFYVGDRLEPQFRLAADRGRRFPEEARLLSAVHKHLSALTIRPSLLHGDLWGGNTGFLRDGEPVVFDPACYYGDRETDLAFTRLFGGFDPAFYRRYRELCPPPENVREPVYNLYHLLNHFLLFGGGYGDQAARTMLEILAELG